MSEFFKPEGSQLTEEFTRFKTNAEAGHAHASSPHALDPFAGMAAHIQEQINTNQIKHGEGVSLVSNIIGVGDPRNIGWHR